jgi:hypothetical protein
MKPRKPQPERDVSFTKGTLCWQTGQHHWRSTTAPNYRVCQNYGCKAVQHLQGGGMGKPVPQHAAIANNPCRATTNHV